MPAGWTDWYGAVEAPDHSSVRGGPYRYSNTPFNVNGAIDDTHAGRYQPKVIGDVAQQLVEKYSKSNSPFFLFASFVAPHVGGPLEPDDPTPVFRNDGRRIQIMTPARPGWVQGRCNARIRRAAGLPVDGGPAEARIGDKPSFLRPPEPNAAERAAMLADTRQRAEAVYVVDRQVGRLVSRLKSLGRWDRTVLVFTSDNGYFQGEHRRRTARSRHTSRHSVSRCS